VAFNQVEPGDHTVDGGHRQMRNQPPSHIPPKIILKIVIKVSS